MKIEKNKVVEVSYELEIDGQIVDTATSEQPLDYIQGTHMLIEKFESELEGREEGYEFSFSVSPEEGYGDYDEKQQVEIPKTAFTLNGEIREDLIQLGRVIPMLDSTGNVVRGIILEIKDNSVIMDFNHPMAGKTMNFKGKVLTVRDATEQELKEGLHGEYLPKEGCHCHGGCHKGEGEGCCHGEGHKDGEGCCHGQGHCHHHDEN